MRPFRDRPLRWKLAALVLPTGVLGLLLVTGAYVGYEWSRSIRTVTEETGVLAQVVAANTAAALSFADADSAQQTLDSLASVVTVELACLYGSAADGGEALIAAFPAASAGDCPPAAPDDDPGVVGSTLRVVRHVEVRGETIGRLLLVRDLREIQKELTEQSVIGAGAFLLALGTILAVLVVGLGRTIVEPVRELASKASQIRTSRDYNLRALKEAEDEIGALVDSFNAMLEEIQAAQKQLVEAEKMASLGALVAGVAHEVNTPIGIGVTATSHLQDELDQLQARYAAGELTHAEMDRFVKHCGDTVALVLTHLKRAIEIISGFKQVAVDQSADQVRDFELAGYVRDIAQSLSPQFKRSPFVLELEAPDAIPVHSYPGAISQIVSNLVINALIHAFAWHDGGTVRVTLSAGADGQVTLQVADNGAGIPEGNLSRIFEPFFTTKRGAGGSGLGLHIVYNLVTQKLHGRIDVSSTVGQGTTFTLRFPARVPE